ncbi:MAG TPA: hypothetical protein VLA89_15485 [Gemmatimonadales bacterium]|nr:hypothetical protein [Gemmatimonadales bacterium]
MNGLEIDSLIQRLADVRGAVSALRAEEASLVGQIAALCQGGAKTRRLVGQSLRVKVESPDPSWDQAKLRILWHTQPAMRGVVLRIDKLGVSLREYAKIRTASGDENFEAFKADLEAACLGERGLPRVTLEEVKCPSDQ